VTESLSSLARLLVLLSFSSLWQAVSGYADVFSHRFIFKTFDPLLNPAHISLYSASLLGLVAILFATRVSRDEPAGPVTSLGLRIALLGVGVEVLSGVVNEVYHQVIVNFFNSNLLHFAIHGLFVVSIFVVAVGGLVASASLLAVRRTKSSAGSSLIFVSSIWLVSVGSVSYVSALAGDAAGHAYLLFGAAVAAAITASAAPVLHRFGVITLASTLFLLVNGALIYFFTTDFALVPFPLVAAAAIEFVWRRSRNYSFGGALLTGALTGLLSYWLLYPYSFVFFDSGPLPSPVLVIPILSATISGLLGAALGSRLLMFLRAAVRANHGGDEAETRVIYSS
jgi:hypothetical protein